MSRLIRQWRDLAREYGQAREMTPRDVAGEAYAVTILLAGLMIEAILFVAALS